MNVSAVIPAQAGIQGQIPVRTCHELFSWTPAFAGVTTEFGARA